MNYRSQAVISILHVSSDNALFMWDGAASDQLFDWDMQVDKNRGQADLSLTQLSTGSKASSAVAASAPPGTLLLGRVGSMAGGVVHVHVGRRTYGRVAMTDIHDGSVPNALEGIQEGLYVKCCVLGTAPEHGKGKQGKTQGPELQLSLQPSKGGKWAGQKTVQSRKTKADTVTVTTVDKLKEGDKVNVLLSSSQMQQLVGVLHGLKAALQR